MVTNATAFGRSGLHDWVWQRISAVIIAAYVFCLLGIFVLHPHLDFAAWRAIYATLGMKLFSVLCLFSLFVHAWIGIWTVTTDYLKNVSVRVGIQSVVIVGSLLYLVWGIDILWSV